MFSSCCFAVKKSRLVPHFCWVPTKCTSFLWCFRQGMPRPLWNATAHRRWPLSWIDPFLLPVGINIESSSSFMCVGRASDHAGWVWSGLFASLCSHQAQASTQSLGWDDRKILTVQANRSDDRWPPAHHSLLIDDDDESSVVAVEN